MARVGAVSTAGLVSGRHILLLEVVHGLEAFTALLKRALGGLTGVPGPPAPQLGRTLSHGAPAPGTARAWPGRGARVCAP